MENSNSLGGARIALLIDFDNVILGIDDPGFDVELVVNALRERGTIVVSRVYGDWYRHNRHRRKLMEHGLELVEAPAFGPVIKNSADIKIALDGFEIGMTMPHINTFCLVSGDSDFLPLIKKLQGLGKNVLVICGNRFTSDMLRRNCNEFISYENLLAASYGADEDATTLEGAFALLHRAMAALRERGSEIRTSTLKQMMIQLNPVFSEKTFGYNQFRGFLDKAGREGLIKLGPRDRVSGEFYVLLPDEDEAEVIDKVERAEPAEVVEEIVEGRKNGGRRRRDDRNDEERALRGVRKAEVKLESRDQRGPAATPDEEAASSRPLSRREARIAALREQEEAQQKPQSSAPLPPAAPVATPLTPATDFSPADAQEARELSISRDELLARGLRPGRIKFSGKTGTLQTVEAEAGEPTPAETIEPDISLTPADAQIETNSNAPVITTEPTEIEPAAQTQTDVETDAGAQAEANAQSEATAKLETEAPAEDPAQEKPRPKRTRRRKKTPDAASDAEASKAETPDAAASDVEAPQSSGANEAKSDGSDAQDGAEQGEPDANAETEEKPKPRRTRRRTKAKTSTEETPATATADSETSTETPMDEKTTEDAPLAKEKPKRTRRRKNTEENTDNTLEAPTIESAATEPDAPVATEKLIEASADTPAAEKSKTRRRRTTRKNAEEAAQAEAEVTENIVTNIGTTDEVTPAELAQIPTPNSEDEV